MLMDAQAVQPDMTVRELSARWRVSERAVQKWIGERAFPNAYRVGLGRGSHWRVPFEDVIAFEDKRRQVFPTGV